MRCVRPQWIELRVNAPAKQPHPMALAIQWVAKITTVALEMFLPAVLGGYLDRRFGTGYLALVGLVFGVVFGIWHLLQMTKATPQGGSRNDGGGDSPQ